MSLEAQKMDAGQRQQIMASVQQQLAIQNAQELLQVRSSPPLTPIDCFALRRNYPISVSRLAFKNPAAHSPVRNKYVHQSDLGNGNRHEEGVCLEMHHAMFGPIHGRVEHRFANVRRTNQTRTKPPLISFPCSLPEESLPCCFFRKEDD